MNAYAERFALSIKSECLNKLVLLSESQLRRAVGESNRIFRHHELYAIAGHLSYSPPVVALVALVVSMAIPPKDVFINIDAARMGDQHTLEVSFNWASCADPNAIRAGWSGASQDEDGWDIRFSLLVLPSACNGAVEKQTRQVDLRTILRQEMTHGKLRINDESLYGHMKKLPALTVSFDLR